MVVDLPEVPRQVRREVDEEEVSGSPLEVGWFLTRVRGPDLLVGEAGQSGKHALLAPGESASFQVDVLFYPLYPSK